MNQTTNMLELAIRWASEYPVQVRVIAAGPEQAGAMRNTLKRLQAPAAVTVETFLPHIHDLMTGTIRGFEGAVLFDPAVAADEVARLHQLLRKAQLAEGQVKQIKDLLLL